MIVIKRKFKNIGWSDKLNFYDLFTGDKLQLKSYNGCLCFIVSGKRIGYKTFTKKSLDCSEPLIYEQCPF